MIHEVIIALAIAGLIGQAAVVMALLLCFRSFGRIGESNAELAARQAEVAEHQSEVTDTQAEITETNLRITRAQAEITFALCAFRAELDKRIGEST